MNNIYNDVIIYNGNVGKLIERKLDGKVIYKFYPAGYGSYYCDELATVDNPEDEVRIAGSASGKEYAIKEFRRYHRDEEYIAISDRYQIIKSVDGLYYPHIKYKSTSRAFHNLESALIGMVVYDKIENDDLHLNKYIFKLLDMEW